MDRMKVSFQVGASPPIRRPPLRILVLADLGAAKRAAGPAVLREAKDFQRLLEEHAPQLVLDVPDRVVGGTATLEYRLQVRSLRDLAPEALLDRLPQLQPARTLRDRLQEVAKGRAKLESLRRTVDALAGAPGLEQPLGLCRQALGAAQTPAAAGPSPAPAEEAGPEDAVHRIMNLVELPSAEERAAVTIGKVVAAVGTRRKQGRPGCPASINEALEQLDTMIAEQLDAVLGHPELQRLEAAWRGLKFLVDRTEFRKEIELTVLHLTRPPVGDPLVEQLFASMEVDLVLAPYLLENPAADAELAQWLAEQAEALLAPLVISVGPAFFGVDAAGVETMRYPGNLLEQPRYLKWNAVQGKDCARWLGVAFNRFLLRSPAEPDAGEASRASTVPLWGDPVWLLGSLVTRSFARLGWPTEAVGAHRGRADDLPIHALRDARGRRVRIPLESLVPHQLVEDLALCGFIALSAVENGDAAFALHAPMLYRPPRPGQAVSLPYQLLASRLARMVGGHIPQLAGAADPRQELEQLVLGLLADTGPDASVQVDLSQDRTAQLRLRTGSAVLGGVVVELAFRLPG